MSEAQIEVSSSPPPRVERASRWSPIGLRFDVPPAEEAEVMLRVARSFGYRATSSALGYVMAWAVLVLLVRDLWGLGLRIWSCSAAIIGSQVVRTAVSRRLASVELREVSTYYRAFLALTVVGALGWSGLGVSALSAFGTTTPSILVVLVIGVIGAGSLGTLSQSDLLHFSFVVSIMGPLVVYCAVRWWHGADGAWAALGMLTSVGSVFIVVQGRRLRDEFIRGVLSRVHLSAARLRAEERARGQQMFLTTMSHEIRTPLHGVLGSAQLFELTDLDEEQALLLDTLRASGDVLLSTINNVLDFSKLEAGAVDLDAPEVDLREVFTKVVSAIAPAAHKKGLSVVYDVHDDVPEGFLSDGPRISQVLVNLVGNAVKFTDHGTIAVSARVVERAGDRLVRVVVADSGAGIDEEAQAVVFSAFAQAHRDDAARPTGTGLGLFISRILVEALGGEAGVSSEVREGSEFWFTVPLRGGIAWRAQPIEFVGAVFVDEPHAPHRAMLERDLARLGVPVASDLAGASRALIRFPDGADAARWCAGLPEDAVVLATEAQAMRLSPLLDGAHTILHVPVRCQSLRAALTSGPHGVSSIPAGSTRSARVLVADDSPVNRMIARRMLEKVGHRAEVVHDGAQAVARLKREAFDVILMDCEMPVMNGFDAARAIRAHEQSSGASRTPILAVTAHVLSGERERCVEAGMDDYIAKPIKLAVLADAIARWAAAGEEGGEQVNGAVS